MDFLTFSGRKMIVYLSSECGGRWPPSILRMQEIRIATSP